MSRSARENGVPNSVPAVPASFSAAWATWKLCSATSPLHTRQNGITSAVGTMGGSAVSIWIMRRVQSSAVFSAAYMSPMSCCW